MQWFTMSMPVPRTRPSLAASSTFVPTPSVDATSTGWSNSLRNDTSIAPPNDPTPRKTRSLVVEATLDLRRDTARFPSSMSTPAAL